MKPQVQSKIGKKGRCLNACLASILEVPEKSVPDFPSGAGYFQAIDAFLKPFGVHYVQRPVTDAPPKNWHTIEGVSPRGGMHAVVGKNGKFIFDPHPVEDDPRRGLVKPERWGVLMPVSEEVRPVGDAREFVVRETPKGWVVFEDGLSGYPFPTKEKAVKHAEGIAAIRTVNGQRAPVRVEAKDVAPVGGFKTRLHRRSEYGPEMHSAKLMEAVKALRPLSIKRPGELIGRTINSERLLAKDTVLRPIDIKRGPGPFTIQLTEKDGREHIEPVKALRAYDAARGKLHIVLCPVCKREVVAHGTVINPHADMKKGGWCKGAAKGEDRKKDTDGGAVTVNEGIRGHGWHAADSVKPVVDEKKNCIFRL